MAKISSILSLGWKWVAYWSVSTRKSNSEMQRPVGKWTKRPWQEGLFCPGFLSFYYFQKETWGPRDSGLRGVSSLARLALRWRVVHMLLASWCTDATGSLSCDAHPLLYSRSFRVPHDHLGQTRALLAYSSTEGTAHILLVKYVYFFPVQVHWQIATDTLCLSKADKRALGSYKPTGPRNAQALLKEAAAVNGART